jgi:NAD(P)-dependent dehydrogenase (short-subunit alcohol dehydrogenase family)
MPLTTPSVVLITGCSTGIGRELAQECVRLGHRVFATARRSESLAELASDRLTPLALDVTSEESIAAAVDQVIATTGRIDVLINNAGLNTIGPVAEVPMGSLRNIFETNVIGLVAVTQAVFPHMAKQRSGRIINIGSVVGLLSTPFAGPYCASKAAVHALSESLRMEVAPFGIDVVVVQPGGVRSHIAATGSQDLARYQTSESFYHPYFDGIQKRAMASQQDAMEADEFAKTVLAQALATSAPHVIRAGRGSSALPKLAKLPVQVRDELLSRQFGLHRKP